VAVTIFATAAAYALDIGVATLAIAERVPNRPPTTRA
jgi:hypothetical protein